MSETTTLQRGRMPTYEDLRDGPQKLFEAYLGFLLKVAEGSSRRARALAAQLDEMNDEGQKRELMAQIRLSKDVVQQVVFKAKVSTYMRTTGSSWSRACCVVAQAHPDLASADSRCAVAAAMGKLVSLT